MTDALDSATVKAAGELVADIPLPGFILVRDDGLAIDVSALDSPELLVRFVDRVFTSQACFEGLNYATFLRLLFDSQPTDINALLEDFEARGVAPWLPLATRIVGFPPERQAYYRGLSLKDGQADYFFEAITTDLETDDGQAISRTEILSFDEFVAAMWLKGLRYGIDEALVREKLAEAKAERMTVAHPRPPAQGSDASVGESAKTMQRNDAPRLRDDGRVDLARYENRFPQIEAGQRLFCKLPSVSGIPGRDVQGRELAAEPVKDFSIHDLAGPGTEVQRIANEGEGEADYVVALINGFLNIDIATGRVSVNEKIINRAGVSARTTGNLSLAGQEYEEHGEVQEKRSVDGHHMSFYADVYGNINSDGGRITIKRTLAGGSAKSPGGEVLIEGAASRATLEARGGSVNIKSAEGCLIIADTVHIESAVMCEIVAETIEIEHAQGCAIAGKRVNIRLSSARRSDANLVSLLLPDLAKYDESRKLLEGRLEKNAATESDLRSQMSVITADAEMKTYMTIAPKIRAKEMVLRGEQEANWQKLVARLAPRIKDMSRLNAQVQETRKDVAALHESIADTLRQRAAAIAAVSCRIDAVSSETLVRVRRMRFEDTPLANLPTKELHMRLREAGQPNERVFFGDSGSVVWPEPAEDVDADADD